MKKTIWLIISFFLLICLIGNAFSEITSESLSKMSIDDLLALRVNIETLIQEKQELEGEIEILSGKYIIGKEIPEGSYEIKARKLYHNYATITLREATGQYITHSSLLNEGQRIKIDAVDGNILELDFRGEYTIKKATPLF